MPRRPYSTMGYEARRIRLVLPTDIWMKVEILARHSQCPLATEIEGTLIEQTHRERALIDDFMVREEARAHLWDNLGASTCPQNLPDPVGSGPAQSTQH